MMLNGKEENRRRQKRKEKGDTKVDTGMKAPMKNRCRKKKDEEKMKRKVGARKLKSMKRSSNERKKRKENWKNGRDTKSLEAEKGHRDIINIMIDWMCPIPPGQPQYYHQFLVPPGLQMPPPTMIPPIRNIQSEERMEIPGTSTGTQPPQRPPSTGNP
uniref:Uncharacterized protein n=1 Tax=Romanomermis culicivorax TaxID=13658 RepID=A0A915I4E9_ROMCU